MPSSYDTARVWTVRARPYLLWGVTYTRARGAGTAAGRSHSSWKLSPHEAP